MAVELGAMLTVDVCDKPGYWVLGTGYMVYGIWYMVGGELMYEEGNRSQTLIIKEEEGAPTTSSYY